MRNAKREAYGGSAEDFPNRKEMKNVKESAVCTCVLENDMI